MPSIGDIHRLLNPIKRKIFLLIGRAILIAVKADTKMMKIQCTGLKNEVGTDIERPQPYGLETYPVKGTEAIVLYPNGNRDQGLAIIVHDEENRPKELSEGDVVLYDKNGSKITLTGGLIKIEAEGGGTLEFSVMGETLDTWLGTHTHLDAEARPTDAPTEATTGILSEGVKNN